MSFGGFPPRPNLQGYVPVPNIFFDEVLPRINNMSELKILLAVFRKTYGWVKAIDQQTGEPIYKLEDSISYSQFEKMTGLSPTSVATGISRAIKSGYLEKIEQGDFTTSSAYRVVTQSESTKEPSSTTFQLQALDVEDIEVDIPKGKPLGKSLAELTGSDSYQSPPLPDEKQSVLDEIFGGPPQKEETEKEKNPHQRFISHWFRCYYSKFNMGYGNITGKEHNLIKSLLKDYDFETLVKAMEFYFNNFNNLDGVPSDYPSITIFYSWRKKIIPAALYGITEKPKRNAREFEPDKWKDDGFFD